MTLKLYTTLFTIRSKNSAYDTAHQATYIRAYRILR